MDVDVPNAVLALAETELTAPLPAVDDENTLPCPKNAGVGWEFREFTAFPDEDICILLLPCLFVAPNVAPVPNDDAPPVDGPKPPFVPNPDEEVLSVVPKLPPA